MLVENKAILRKAFDIVNRILLASVAYVENAATRCSTWTELFENVTNQDVLATWRELDLRTTEQRDRDHGLFACGSIGSLLSWATFKILWQVLAPLWRTELSEEAEGALVDLVDVLAAIYRSRWIVRIEHNQRGVNELVQGLTTYGLA